jgi:hypothetical protein
MPLPINFQYSEVADENAYQNYATSDFSDVLGSSWDDAIEYNPTTAIKTLLSSDDQNTPLLSPAEANNKYAIGDLKFDSPTLDSTAKRLHEAKYGEIKRSEIQRTGPQGFGVSAAKLGTNIVASMTDPLNVAAAFFPSFAIGKVAAGLNMARPAFIAGGGSVAARAAGGAVEGIVGTAMLEPLPYMAAKKNQLEYGLADSMLNIAVGGILGGGLHGLSRHLEIRGERAEARRVSDLNQAIDVLPPESRMRVLQSAFSEVAQGRFPVNASNLLAREILQNQPKGL